MNYRSTLIAVLIICAGTMLFSGCGRDRSSERSPPSVDAPDLTEVAQQNSCDNNQKGTIKAMNVSVFIEGFAAGVKLPDDESRWQAWRRLGIDLSDQDFQAAENQVDRELETGNTPRFNESWARLAGLTSAEYVRMLAVQAAVFSEWATRDPLAAVTWAYGFQTAVTEWGLWTINTGGGSDPADAWNAVDQRILLSKMVAQWAKSDSRTATAWVESLPEDIGQAAARYGLAIAQADSAPESALSSLESIAYSSEMIRVAQNATTFVFRKWASVDRPALLAWIDDNAILDNRLDSNKAVMRYYAVTAAAESLASENIPSALQWADNLPIHARDHARDAIVREWARKDLPAARQWVSDTWTAEEGDKHNAAMLWSIATEWLKSDPKAAAEWAFHLTDKHDPDGALGKNVNIVSFIVSRWATIDAGAALAWVEALPDGPLKDRVHDSAVQGQARKAVTEAPSFRDLRAIIEEVPQRARDQVWIHAISAWKPSDPAARSELSDYLTALPSGNSRDTFLTFFVSRSIPDPDVLRLANEIENDGWRQRAVESAVQSWLLQDREAAMQWLRHASLPRDMKDRWLSQ